MGRTPKPLTIWVPEGWKQKPEIQALVDKGHDIREGYLMGSTGGIGMEDFDLIFGPNCWKMDARLIKYLDLAVKAARAIKYPKKEKK